MALQPVISQLGGMSTDLNTANQPFGANLGVSTADMGFGQTPINPDLSKLNQQMPSTWEAYQAQQGPFMTMDLKPWQQGEYAGMDNKTAYETWATRENANPSMSYIGNPQSAPTGGLSSIVPPATQLIGGFAAPAYAPNLNYIPEGNPSANYIGTPQPAPTGGLTTVLPTSGTNMPTVGPSVATNMAQTNDIVSNPLASYSSQANQNYVTPPTLATAGSPTGGSFTQGAALPNITTTQAQATAAPQFYTDYLSNLASQGQQAASGASYVGAQPLQQQAFNQVAQNVGNYQPTLQNAINLASSVGGSNLAETIGNIGQANIARNLAPQATSGLVGTGQFGSSRGAAALGDVIANAELGITQQQAQALQQDYANRLNASAALGNLASQTQSLGLGDINALATLGGQQQTIAQNEQLFPMQQLTNAAALLRGYQMPTSTSSTYTGPIPGAYSASPLQQIAGLGALAAGVSNTELGGAIGTGLKGLGEYLSGLIPSFSSSTPVTSIPNTSEAGTDASGWQYFTDGTAISPDGTYYYQGNEVYTPPPVEVPYP